MADTLGKHTSPREQTQTVDEKGDKHQALCVRIYVGRTKQEHGELPGILMSVFALTPIDYCKGEGRRQEGRCVPLATGPRAGPAAAPGTHGGSRAAVLMEDWSCLGSRIFNNTYSSFSHKS